MIRLGDRAKSWLLIKAAGSLKLRRTDRPLGFRSFLRRGSWTNEWHVDFSKAFTRNDIYKEGLTCVDGFAKVHQRQGGPRIGCSNEQLFRSQFEFLRRQFLQDGELPFVDVLARETVQQALDTIEVAWNERIYTPLVTLWIFLGQVIRRSFVSRSRCSIRRPPSLARPAGMFFPHRRILPSAKASA